MVAIKFTAFAMCFSQFGSKGDYPSFREHLFIAAGHFSQALLN